MGLPVTVYRWDDVGAPQLTSQKPSEIINILQKCLVDGYGDKAPLGWTKEYEDTILQKAVFRNSPVDGSGGYFQIWSHDETDTSGRLMRIASSKSMSGIDSYFQKSYETATHAPYVSWDRWAVIGTTRAFYLILSTDDLMGGNNSHGDNTCYFGDFDPFIPDDQNTFITCGQTGYSGDFTSTSMTSYGSSFTDAFRLSSLKTSPETKLFKLGGADGQPDVVDYGIWVINNVFYTSPLQGVSDINTGVYFPVLIAAYGVYPNANATDVNGTLMRQSLEYPLYRGKLAGMNITMSPRCENFTWPTIQTDFGVNHWVLRSSGSVQGVIVNMVTWHD